MLSTSACVLALIGTSAAFAPQAIYLPRAVSALPRTAAQFGRRAEYRTAPQRHVINTFTMSAQSIPARQAGLTAALSELSGALIKIVRAAIFSCFVACMSTLPAVAATRRAGTSFFSSDIVKYGALGVVMLAGSMFSKSPPPTLIETTTEDGTVPVTEEPESLDGTVAGPGPTARMAREGSESVAAETASLEDDGALFSSLAGRMQQLAEERRLAEEGETDGQNSPDDSTDTWGEGNTAVLEPPKPEGVLEGEPAVDFPTGFPLIDGEVVEVESEPAAASEEQIEMLKRMMGGTN